MHSKRFLTCGLAGLLAAMLAACAAPPASNYYTLLPQAAQAGQPPKLSHRLAIDVQAVNVPQQVDRPQIVLNQPGSARVTPLNGALWAAPLSEEIRSALADALVRRLDALDASGQRAGKDLPLWVVRVTVQRFESVHADHAVLAASWRLTPRNQSSAHGMLCRAQIRVEVGPGMPALVQGHQQAVLHLADLVAAGIAGTPAQPAPGVVQQGCMSVATGAAEAS